MKKVLLWTDETKFEEEKNVALVINPDQVVQKVDLSCKAVYLFEGLEVTAENKEKLDDLLPQLNECDGVYDVQNIINSVFDHVDVQVAEDSEMVRDILCYFEESQTISNLSDCDVVFVVFVYEYWDGSNWKEIWFNDAYMAEYEVIYDEENTENLDRWDGSNCSFRGRFNHGLLHPIVKIDDEEVENQFLFEQYTQYQGDIPTAEIIDAETATELREEVEENI